MTLIKIKIKNIRFGCVNLFYTVECVFIVIINLSLLERITLKWNSFFTCVSHAIGLKYGEKFHVQI